jgi:hypothetical protein
MKIPNNEIKNRDDCKFKFKRINISIHLHTRLKLLAAKNNLFIQDLSESIIESYMSEVDSGDDE